MTDSSDPVRAAVYLDSEQARELAEQVLGPLEPNRQGSFSGVVEDELEPSQVKRLNDAGLVVELVEGTEADVPEPSDGPTKKLMESAEAIDEIKQNSKTVSFSADESRLVLGEAPVADHDPRLHQFGDYDATPTEEQALHEDAYNIDIRGPITRKQRLELDGLGVDIAAFEPGVGYRAFLTREQYAAMLELPYVAGVSRYEFAQAITPELLESVAEENADEQPGLMSGEEQGASETQVFDCLVHREEDLEKILELIDNTPGTTIVDSSNLRVRFSADAQIPLIAALAALPEVRKIWPYEAPTL
jgi:hypothetical protein